jgi:low temperature requirement protein LtrA
VVVAAGIKKAVGHAFGHLTLGQALALAGGVAIYLVADVAFRRILDLDRLRYRAIGAVLAFATVPLGLTVAAAQLFALIVLLMAMLYVEANVPSSGEAGQRGTSEKTGKSHR